MSRAEGGQATAILPFRSNIDIGPQGRRDREPKLECQREDCCERPMPQITNEIGLPARTHRIARHSIVPVEYTLHFGRRVPQFRNEDRPAEPDGARSPPT